MLAQYALAWLLTYLLHSTLLLSLAWLASKPLARWSVAAEEAVWKLALVGALLTPSLQLVAGWEPAAGRWSLAQAPAAELTMTNRTDQTDRVSAAAFRMAPADLPVAPAAAVPSTPERSASPSRPTLPAIALALWAL